MLENLAATSNVNKCSSLRSHRLRSTCANIELSFINHPNDKVKAKRVGKLVASNYYNQSCDSNTPQ